MTRYVALIAVVLVITVTTSNAAEVIGLGVLYPSHPNSFMIVDAVSANGLVAVGYGQSSIAKRQAFRWTEQTKAVGIGFLESSDTAMSEATAVSCDGSVIVGFASSPLGTQAFRWTQATGMQPLGFLDLSAVPPESRATAVSCDGSVVAGYSTSVNGWQAFRWTMSGSMAGLGDLPGGGFESRALGMSYDGKVIAGISDSGALGGYPEAFVWTLSGMQGIKDDPSAVTGLFNSRAFAVAGYSTGLANAIITGKATPEQAFRWTWQNGLAGLGFNVPGPYIGLQSFGNAISGDGSVIVGRWVFVNQFLTSRAMIWMQPYGVRDLKTTLLQQQVSSVVGWILLDAVGISASGKVIVGNGTNPMDAVEPWLIRDTPPPPKEIPWEKAVSHIICCWQPPIPQPIARVFDGSLSGTSSECAPLVSHEWSFGDGGTATGEIGRHTFRAPGRYRVELTVRDSCRGTAIDALDVEVVEGER